MDRNKKRAWTAADTRRLSALAGQGRSASEIATQMDRNSRHILQRAKRDAIAVRRVSVKTHWTRAEESALRKLYSSHPAVEIAKQLGKSELSVYNRAFNLGLSKPAGYAAQVMRQRWQDGKNEGCRAGQFQPGQVPANKGLRRPGWGPGRMAETQFKKGRPACEARNYVPIGTERIDPKRGVLIRKLTDDPSVYPASRWRPVHVLVWEAAHGHVPPGHIVIFRPGMKTMIASEITLDRVELVTRRENMRRNTVHNLPSPLPQLIQLRGALNRKIRRIERTNHEKQD